MKKLLLSGVLMTALVLSACDQSVNEPVDSSGKGSFLKAVEKLDLTTDQLAQVDEMFYLEEDMGCLLNPIQMSMMNTLATGGQHGTLDERGRMDRRRALDVAALIYYRLIVRANPELDDATKKALRELIVESHKIRIGIIRDNQGDPAAIRALLATEHARLIGAMTALLSPEQIARVEALKAKIEQERKERRERWIEHRINFQVQMMTRWLGLSEQQALDIKQILLNQHAAIQNLRQLYTGDPEGFRTALRALLAETNELILSKLTDEQKDKWNRRLHRGMTDGGGMDRKGG